MKRPPDVVTRRISPWSFVSFANSETFNQVFCAEIVDPPNEILIETLSGPHQKIPRSTHIKRSHPSDIRSFSKMTFSRECVNQIWK